VNISNKIKLATASVSLVGLSFIMAVEGTEQVAYLDSVKVPTICVGHTKGVYLGQKATLEQCETWLKEDSSYAGKAVKRLVKVDLTQPQYDALVSFTFNLGEGALASSTLLRKINSGECVAAAKEFLKWDKARVNGRLIPLRGLTKRRQGESTMWLSGC